MPKRKRSVDDGAYTMPEDQRIPMTPDELAIWIVRGGGMPEDQKPKDAKESGS